MLICYLQAVQELLRALREKKLALDIHYQDMERRLTGLPELVKQALDHAAQLQQEADSLDESVCHALVSLINRVIVYVSMFITV